MWPDGQVRQNRQPIREQARQEMGWEKERMPAVCIDLRGPRIRGEMFASSRRWRQQSGRTQGFAKLAEK